MTWKYGPGKLKAHGPALMYYNPWLVIVPADSGHVLGNFEDRDSAENTADSIDDAVAVRQRDYDVFATQEPGRYIAVKAAKNGRRAHARRAEGPLMARTFYDMGEFVKFAPVEDVAYLRLAGVRMSTPYLEGTVEYISLGQTPEDEDYYTIQTPDGGQFTDVPGSNIIPVRGSRRARPHTRRSPWQLRHGHLVWGRARKMNDDRTYEPERR